MNNQNNMDNMNFINNTMNMMMNYNNMNMMMNNNSMNKMNNMMNNNNMNNMLINNNMNMIKNNNMNNNINNNINNKVNMMNNINYNINTTNMNEFKPNNIIIKFLYRSDKGETEIEIESFLYENTNNLISKYKNLSNNKDDELKFIFNARALNLDLTLAEAGLKNNSIIIVIKPKQIKKSGPWLIKEINIKFIKISKNNNYKNNNQEIIGVLKLCLLKEVSQKIPYNRLAKLPTLIYYIMEIISNGFILGHPIIKKDFEDVLEKMRGSSIINFANYVDEIIDLNQINKILNLLEKDNLKEKENNVQIEQKEFYIMEQVQNQYQEF